MSEGTPRKNWHLPAAVLAVVLILAASCSKKSDAELANEALQQGIAAQQAGRLPEAAADYVRAACRAMDEGEGGGITRPPWGDSNSVDGEVSAGQELLQGLRAVPLA